MRNNCRKTQLRTRGLVIAKWLKRSTRVASVSEIQRIEKEIEKPNRDMSLKNRCGARVLPYELLAPSSEPGVTCRGYPNSVSI
ncbi:linoleate 13S-lipoxygenase 3-1, chloroplastic-like protein [Tanacetum coccineum]